MADNIRSSNIWYTIGRIDGMISILSNDNFVKKPLQEISRDLTSNFMAIEREYENGKDDEANEI